MRASSLSNPDIIDLLNRYFVPVHVDGVYVNKNPSTDAEEKAAYRGGYSGNGWYGHGGSGYWRNGRYCGYGGHGHGWQGS